MTDFETKLLQHFEPFHEYLAKLAELSDASYPEGGMTWGFEYLHGAAHTAKIDGKNVSTFIPTPNLDKHIRPWSRLISKASGNFDGSPKSIVPLDLSLSDPVANPTSQDQAKRIIDWFQSAAADKCIMSFDFSEIDINFASALLVGNNALLHWAFWSVD